MFMARDIIALDADGVLLDLNLGYASAWQRAFGQVLVERDPAAYWPIDRWHVDRLDEAGRAHFRSHFDKTFWTTVPALAGAVDACERLHAAGFELVCVSALDAEFEAARLRNLREHGFPIDRVVATGNDGGERSPKADAIARIGPVAFVDDYLPYFRGVCDSVHRALIVRGSNGSPNVGSEMALADSVHDDLAAFAEAWLGARQGTSGLLRAPPS